LRARHRRQHNLEYFGHQRLGELIFNDMNMMFIEFVKRDAATGGDPTAEPNSWV
jgi:hypothetical protein